MVNTMYLTFHIYIFKKPKTSYRRRSKVNMHAYLSHNELILCEWKSCEHYKNPIDINMTEFWELYVDVDLIS
jgi:hypothetical protein